MLMHEIRNAGRRLSARPGYSLLSVSVLGLGLGAMLFLLSAVNGLVLEPMPFPHAERLVSFGALREGDIGVGGMNNDDHVRLARELHSYEAIGTYDEMTVNISLGDAGPRRYSGVFLSHEMTGLLGMQPLLGRPFNAADDVPGNDPVILISHHVWRDDFAADPAVIGRSYRINGRTGTIVGVMPPEFRFPFRQEVWLARRAFEGSDFGAQTVARLRPEVTLAQARAELESVAQTLGDELVVQRGGGQLVLKPLSVRFVNEMTRSIVWMMFAAGALVLLLACANVANLQLSQILSRRRELAVRSALGAGRGRLLRELLFESLLLSISATVIALVLAHLGGRWIIDVFVASDDAPVYYVSFDIDARMIGFAALAALATTLLAGLLPALRAASADVQDALRDGEKGSSGGGFARFAKALVVVEVALTVVLLVGAGMFIRAMNNVLAFDFGTRVDPSTVMTGRVGLFPEQYPSGAEQARFFERVAERLRAEPGVLAASVANSLPGTASGGSRRFAAEGEPRPGASYPRALVGQVDDHFASTYGLRVTAGRFFDARDQADSAPVAVIDARMAQALWPGRDPLGRRFVVDPETERTRTLTVVGTLEPVHLESADDAVLPTFLVPLRQDTPRFATLAVRLPGDAAGFGPRLAAIVRGEDADTPVYWLRTQERAIQMGRVGPVVLTQIFTGIGLLALVLAAAGLYGVLAFAVVQRTREIGIRRAIGAGRRGIVGTVGSRVLWQVALGLAIGIVLALPWSSLLANPALQTRGYDPAVFIAVVMVVVVVAVLAALAPLCRALRVDPMVALRNE